MITVVVADDHPMFRYGLRAMLQTASDIDRIGEASTGRELLQVVDELQPDVVLTDLAMPDLDGIAATKALLDAHPETAVVVLTMHDDDESLIGALRAGARGYVLKGADGSDIARTVRAAAAGDAVYGPSVARRIVGFFTGTQDRYAAQVFPDLSRREREVLDLIATGCNNLEIGRRLHIADKTVRNHISAVLLKLQVPDRAAAIIRAREAGLGRSTPHDG